MNKLFNNVECAKSRHTQSNGLTNNKRQLKRWNWKIIFALMNFLIAFSVSEKSFSQCNTPNITLTAGTNASAGLGATETNKIITINPATGGGGVLLIDIDITLEGCDLQIGKDVTIRVAPGHSLTLTTDPISGNVTYLHTCVTSPSTCMWDGIHLNGTTAVINTTYGTKIEDAENGIYTLIGNGSTIFSGGVLSIDGTFFKRNRFGIKLQAGSYAAGGVEFSEFDGSLILKDAAYGTYTDKHIDLSDAADFAIGSSLGNIFYGGNKGVYYSSNSSASTNSALSVWYNIFDSQTSYGLQVFRHCDLEANYNDFQNETNTGTGEAAFRVGTNCSLTATNNTFDHNYRDIYINNNPNSDISLIGTVSTNVSKTSIYCVDNNPTNLSILSSDITFASSPSTNATGIWINEASYNPVSGNNATVGGNNVYGTYKGIYTQNVAQLLVNNNSVTLSGAGTSGNRHDAILLENCKEAYIENNFITSTSATYTNGIVFSACDGAILCYNRVSYLDSGIVGAYDMTTNSTLKVSMTLNEMDHCTAGFVLEYSGDIGEQGSTAGSADDVNDNQWTNNTYDSYAKAANLSNATFFDVRSSASPWAIISTGSSGGGIPITSTTLSPYTSPADCPSSPYTAPAMQQERALNIANDANDFALLSDEKKWIARKELMDAINRGNTAIDVTDNDIASFVTEMNSEATGQLSSVGETISSAFSGSAGVDTSIIADAKTENENVEAYTLFEYNLKRTNEIYLRTAAIGEHAAFDSTDIAFLDALAAQCLYDGGPAVFMARSLMADYNESVYENIDCNDNSNSSRKAHAVNNQQENNSLTYFSIYPNPAKDFFNLNYRLPTDNKIYSMQIIDVMGNKISDFTLSDAKNKMRILVNSFSAGVYYGKIISENATIKDFKIVVIK